MTDVLPGSARPRRSWRNAVLPAVLVGELLLGVALGATRPWQDREPAAPSAPAPAAPSRSDSRPTPLRTAPPAASPSSPAPRTTHPPVNPFSPH